MADEAAQAAAPAIAVVENTAIASQPAPGATPAASDDLAAAIAHEQAIVNASAGRKNPDVKPEVALLENRREADTPAAAAADPEKPAEPATTEAAAAKTDEKPPEDAVAANVAKYLRQERLARQEREAARAERVAIEKERQQLAVDREAVAKERNLRELAKRDPYAATKELLGDETLRGGFVVEMLNRMAAEESGEAPQLTDAQREEQIVAKAKAAIRAEQEAEAAKAREAEEKANQAKAEQTARGKEAFFVGLASQFKTEREKYPFLAAEPVDVPTIDSWLKAEYQRTGRIAKPEEIFAHFDSVQEARAQRLSAAMARKSGGAKPTAAPAKLTAAASAPVSRTVDTRGSTPAQAGKGPSWKEAEAAVIARLNALDGR